jgi:hypothetical protein
MENYLQIDVSVEKGGLLSPNQAAKILNVSERRLSRWRLEGGGPEYVKLGHRSVRYASEALQSFIVRRTSSNTSEVAA